MKHHIGTDIIEISRIEKAVDRWEERFLQRVYTERELELCHKHIPSLAVRFAGKEAVIKALGPERKRIGWKDIEILSRTGGKPCVKLYGEAQSRARSLKLNDMDISLSHSREYAIAFVVGATI